MKSSEDKQQQKLSFYSIPMHLIGNTPGFVNFTGGRTGEGRISNAALLTLMKLYWIWRQYGNGAKFILSEEQIQELGPDNLKELSETQVGWKYNRFVIQKDLYSYPDNKEEIFEGTLIDTEPARDGGLSVVLNVTDGCLKGQNYFIMLSKNAFSIYNALSPLETMLLLWFYYYYRMHYKKFAHMEISVGVEAFVNMRYFNGLLVNNPDARYLLELAFEKFTKYNILLKGILGREEVFIKLSPLFFYSLDYLKRRGRGW